MNRLKINIKGKRIESFIGRLIKANIDLINIEYISYQEINIIINKCDYIKLKKLKTTYQIKIVRKYGLSNIKDKIIKNKIIIIFSIIGLIILFLLSNIIFSIKIIHNDEKLRSLLYQELNDYGIGTHHFKKSRKQIEKIKEQILQKYKDKIEWLEIEEVGTTYIVRVQARIIPNIDNITSPQNIVAKKNAVIKSIEAKSGNVEKLRGEYVNKGDIIINGNIKLNENLMSLVRAEGTVYGEVWYTIDISYPYVYQEEKLTDNETLNLTFHFFNKSINLLGDKYKYKKTVKKIRISSDFLPIYISIDKNREINKIDYILTCDQAANKSILKANEKIEHKLKEGEYIISSKVIETACDIDRANLKIFYAVLENITDYQSIN